MRKLFPTDASGSRRPAALSRRGWLAIWLQARRRRRRAGNGLPNVPGVTDLAVVLRDAMGFQVAWSSDPAATYRGYYRIQGQPAWISLSDLAAGAAALDVPEATQHAFELKVTARGDGESFSSTEVDSNVVVTVNDSTLPDAPIIDDLNVGDVQATSVQVQWASVLSPLVSYTGFYRESPAGNWTMGVSGYASDGAVEFSGLQTEVEYGFKIQTIGAGNQGDYNISTPGDSDEVTATPGGE